MPIATFARKKKAYGGPDQQLVRDQMTWMQRMLAAWGREPFAKFMFWILQKKPDPGEVLPQTGFWNRRLVPFKFNRVQQDIDNRASLRNILLKYRQGGYTTYFIINRLFLRAVTEPGFGGLLISQTHHYAASHFMIMKRTYRYMSAENPYDRRLNILTQQLHEHLLNIEKSNRRELVFDQLDSRILCDSAEIEEVGQGLTLNAVVATEAARWPRNPEETLANVKEAIVEGGTLDIESTANELGGYFYEECMRAREGSGEFTYFFHEWPWEEAYKDEDPIKAAELNEEEQEIRKRFNLDLYQMMWRRKKYIALRHNFAEKYPEDDITCFLVKGRTFFDRDILRQRMIELANYEPLASYREGDLRVFKRPLKNRRYIIGADPAEGRTVSSDDTDFAACVVLDLDTGEECAALRARLTPEDFAFDLAELGHMYNDAMVAVERNAGGGTVILALEIQAQYYNIYKHREWTKKDAKRYILEIAGFPTTPKTRPIALNKLASLVRNEPELFWDKVFVDEAIRFIRNPAGKPEASQGAHDDTVMCRAIAHYVRLVVLGYLDPVVQASERYGAEESDEPEAAA